MTDDHILAENREMSDTLERPESKLLDLEIEQALDFYFLGICVVYNL